MRSCHPAKFAKIWISVEKFKFSQILAGDKNATSPCFKSISALNEIWIQNYLGFIVSDTNANTYPFFSSEEGHQKQLFLYKVHSFLK